LHVSVGLKSARACPITLGAHGFVVVGQNGNHRWYAAVVGDCGTQRTSRAKRHSIRGAAGSGTSFGS
jgi:hypothetical protein